MQQASKWKEAITGDPYELEFLRKMSLDMNLRMELWKYVEVSTHTIRDWRNQWFKKVKSWGFSVLSERKHVFADFTRFHPSTWMAYRKSSFSYIIIHSVPDLKF